MTYQNIKLQLTLMVEFIYSKSATRFSLLAFFFALTSCASNPTGGVNFVLMSENQEISKGEELHLELQEENTFYNDPELLSYVNKVGQELAAKSHRPDLEYHFNIIDSPDINAFALPGGYIYINRGLLAYLTSEAQLAAVLGHEIGHVTARHSVRSTTAQRATSAVSNVLVFATGSAALQQTASLFGGALISGYGRDMELEADSLSAEYLYNSGYQPNAMVDVITVLKNHEDFNKKISNNVVSYHGLFSSHPRNDTRLRRVVATAGELPADQETEIDPELFRGEMEGLLLGPSIQAAIGNNTEALNRYYQTLFNYTMIFPNAWQNEETTTTVTASSAVSNDSLLVNVQRLQSNIEPRIFIRENLHIPNLQRSETLSQYGLRGYTGINPDTNQRVAVIYYGPRAFIFTGTFELNETGISNTADEIILSAIKTFRPITRNEQAYANPVKIKYVVSDGTPYSDLAKESRIQQYPEDLLRLYNGDYPNGEPQVGEWIKVAN